MIDIKAARVSGALQAKKARVLWKDGILKLFGFDGLITTIDSTEPTLVRRGIHAVWQADTSKGRVELKTLCMTCHGWWRVIRLSAKKLWEAA